MTHNFFPFLIISAFVAFLDILPLLIKRRPWRYNTSMFVQTLVAGMVIFAVSLPALPWWAQGPVIAVVLSLPMLILPLVRGAYVWYGALLNSIVVGFVFSLIHHSLPAIASFFSAAA